MSPRIFALAFIAAVIAYSHFLHAETTPAIPDSSSLTLTFPQPLNADLSSEASPSISPEGRWLLYISNRSGNYDLWIRAAAGGVPEPLTSHPADDYSPTWSPDGDQICFVSNRDDPQGDIYVLNFTIRSGIPRPTRVRPIVTGPGFQGFPSYSKDKRYLVYQDGRASQAQVMLFDLRKRKTIPLTGKGYLQPAFSTRSDHILCIAIPEEGYGGEICLIDPGNLKDPQPQIDTVYSGFFPAALPTWAPASDTFIAVLTNRDEDGDGFLTPLDGQDLFRFDLADSIWVPGPITLGDASYNYPYWANDGYVYYVSDQHGNPDLWRLPAEGIIPRASTAEQGFRFALSIGQEAEVEGRTLTHQEILAKLLALENVRRDFPQDRAIGALTLLESARLLTAIGQVEEVETYLKRIPRLYPEQRNVLAEAEIDYQMRVHNARFLPNDEFRCENPIFFISNLSDILKKYPEQETASARALYLIGATKGYLGDPNGALDSYNAVVTNFPGAEDYPAEALLGIARIYTEMDRQDAALAKYLQIVEQFSDHAAPTEKAIAQIIDLQVSIADPIAGLQDLIGKYANLPALAAAAQKRIANLLTEQGERELAISEYDRLRGYAARYAIPYIRMLLAQGMIAAANIENDGGEALLAQMRLEKVELEFGDLQEGYFSRQARHLRITMLAQRAEELSRAGDFELALADFDRALLLDPGNLRLHRGKIAAAYALGRLSPVAEGYRRQLGERPDDPSLLYALGLCLSYIGEENLHDLQASNALIEKALSIQPALAHGYLTLGYNYELMEKLGREHQPSGGFIRSSLRTLGRALSRLGRFLTFRGEERPFQGYEKAIEILQLGLAVNEDSLNPELEAQMLGNLGNDYYQLGEFGYPRALNAYLERLRYDSTFASPEQEALVRERMGQAAAIVERNDLAKECYLRSLQLYHDSRPPQAELRVLLRLAELYQVSDEPEESNAYYKRAAAVAHREGLTGPRTKWWENMAFNALKLGDDQEALRRTQTALNSLPPPNEIPVEKVYNPLILEILGVPIPIMNFGYLGTGSPMSALGLTKRDELLLNYSIAQEVYTRGKDVQAARSEAFRRLAIAVWQADAEAQSALWSEIGYFDWADNKLIAARRDFRRSLELCERNGLRSGRLSALINLASVQLQSVAGDSILGPQGNTIDKLVEICRSEANLFGQYEIGYSRSRWLQIEAALEKLPPHQTLADVRKKLRRSLRTISDPETNEETRAEQWDWSLLDHLLLLGEDPFPSVVEFTEKFKGEIENFRRDPLGFQTERIRFYDLYAQLCLERASNSTDSTIKGQLQQLELEGEALWSMREGIDEAEKRGQTELLINLEINLSDYLYSMEDMEGCVNQLASARQQAEASGRDDLLWRVFWRFGRLVSKAQGQTYSQTPEILENVFVCTADEWYEQAVDLYENLPEESPGFMLDSRRQREARVMFDLAVDNALKNRDYDRFLTYDQKAANLGLYNVCQTRVIPIQSERRKFVWGAEGGTVPYLRREMQRLKEKIAALEQSGKADSLAVDSTRTALGQTESEYTKTLNRVTEEDPEFASLFSLPAFPKDTLRNALEPGDLLVQIIDMGGDVLIVELSPATLTIHTENRRSPIVSALRDSLAVVEINDGTRFQQLSSELFNILFGQIRESILGSERVFLVVPEAWSDIPFEQLWTGTQLLGENRNVYRLPDLQSSVFLNEKPSIGRGENIAIGFERNPEGFSGIEINRDQTIQEAIEAAGVVLVRTESEETAHPFDRVLFRTEKKTWKISDLFSLNCHGDVLFLMGDFKSKLLVTRAGFFAGFSSVIFLPKIISDKVLDQFMTAFLETRQVDSPGEAFQQALKTVSGGDSNNVQLSGFQYYGNGGLNRQQRAEYAQNNFQRTVLKGNYNLEQGDGEWALRYYDRALIMAQEIGDSSAIQNLQQLRIQAARMIGQWDVAVRAQTVLNKLAENRGDLRALETGQRNLSVYDDKLGDIDNAIIARNLAREAAAVRGDEIQAAADDQILATLYEKKGDYARAEAILEQAGKTFFEWEEVDKFITTEIYVGRLFVVQENYARALEILECLGQQIQQFAESSGQKTVLPVEYYQHLGLAYEGLTDYELALEAELKGLRALGDTISASSALSHQYLAGLYWKKGDYQKALDQIYTAKDQYNQLGLKQYAFLSENTEALIHLSLGDIAVADQKAKSALEGAVLSGDIKSQSQIEKNLGLIELASGQPQKAKTRFLSVLEIDAKLRSQRGQAYGYLDLGNAYLHLDQLDSAQTALDKALEMNRTISDARIQARALLGLGLVNLRRRSPEKALQNLKQAAIIAEERGLEDLSWRVYLASAKAEESDGRYKQALNYLDRAMTRVEEMRASIAAEALKSGFMEDKVEIYRLAAGLHLREDNPEAALGTVERARSRAFLDILQRGQISREAGLDASSTEKEADLTQRMSKTQAEIGWLKGKGSARTPEEDAQLARYETDLDSLQNAYSAFLVEIESRHPGFRSLVSVDPEPPGEVKRLLKSGEILLEFFALPDEMAIFVVTPDKIQARTVKISADTLAEKVSNIRRRIDKKLSIEDESKELYRLLIAPVAEHLMGNKSLIIVPFGVLHYLPFALLQDESGDYLIDKFTLSLAPSANIFSFCRERAGERSPIGDQPILAFGDPATTESADRLFFAEKEVESIGFTFPETKLLLGKEAQEAVLLKEASDYGVFHFSCHGLFDASNPLFSGLFLAPGGSDDGRLEMREIFGLHLDRCALVTLSACESGLGGLAGGDEIIGLNRAFIYAGSPRVVSTLWKVDDLATAVLVKHFYRNLRTGLNPAEALQKAQLHVRDRIHPHPAYWAAFVLVGEPELASDLAHRP